MENDEDVFERVNCVNVTRILDALSADICLTMTMVRYEMGERRAPLTSASGQPTLLAMEELDFV
jgi:hypothetical protein